MVTDYKCPGCVLVLGQLLLQPLKLRLCILFLCLSIFSFVLVVRVQWAGVQKEQMDGGAIVQSFQDAVILSGHVPTSTIGAVIDLCLPVAPVIVVSQHNVPVTE